MADFAARPGQMQGEMQGEMQAPPLGGSAPAGSTCPDCGSAVRAGQEWCTLCLRVLGAKPSPARVAVADPVDPVDPADPATPKAAATPAGPAGQPLTPEAAAAAEALLAQLAIDIRRTNLQLPSMLRSKARVAVAAAVLMVVLCAGVLLLMTVLGSVF